MNKKNRPSDYSYVSFSTESDLIRTNQSRFETGGSCSNQLLPVAHKLCESFVEGFEGQI